MNYFVRRQDNEYGKCDGMLHEIKAGDTLYKISRMYNVSMDDLMEKNPMVDVYNLQIGDRLCVPIKHMPYVTVEGDTLDVLLERFHMSYEDFRMANPRLAPLRFPENTVVYIPDSAMTESGE